MAMTLVSTVTVGSGGAASIEFTNIPQTGKDLLVVMSARFDSSNNRALLYLNGVTGEVYSRRVLQGDGSSASSSSSSFSGWLVGCRSDDTASTFGNSQGYISNYTASGVKSMSVDGVRENNATASEQSLFAISRDSGAVTQINLTPLGGSFVQYSTASLYIIS